MTDKKPVVFIVDDEEAIRDSLGMLLESVGIDHMSFESGHAFLDHISDDISGCVVSDIRMPGISGLELQQALMDRRINLPMIFITGHGDVPMAVDAMRQGALDFLSKPFREQELLDRINEAFSVEYQRRESLAEVEDILQKIKALSAREREVFERISNGQANKVVAIELGISERTVEVHRSSIMRKMKANTLAHLVRMKLLADQTA